MPAVRFRRACLDRTCQSAADRLGPIRLYQDSPPLKASSRPHLGDVQLSLGKPCSKAVRVQIATSDRQENSVVCGDIRRQLHMLFVVRVVAHRNSNSRAISDHTKPQGLTAGLMDICRTCIAADTAGTEPWTCLLIFSMFSCADCRIRRRTALFPRPQA